MDKLDAEELIGLHTWQSGIKYQRVEHLPVGKGWRDLLTDCLQQMHAADPTFKIYQIKEKFGGLRLYWSTDATPDTDLEDFVKEAELESYQTCEECGAPGSPGGTSWIKTLCEEHKRARKARKR